MKGENKLRFAEALMAGHPDRLCDTIAGMVSDFMDERVPKAKGACRCLLSDRIMVLSGDFVLDKTIMEEAKTLLPFRIKALLGELFREKGDGPSWDEIKKVVDFRMVSGIKEEEVFFGFATAETDEMLPMASVLAKGLADKYDSVFKEGKLGLGASASVRVGVSYEGDVPRGVSEISFSLTKMDMIGDKRLKDFLTEEVVKQSIGANWLLPGWSLATEATPLGGGSIKTGCSNASWFSEGYGFDVPFKSVAGRTWGSQGKFLSCMARFAARGVVGAGLSEKVLVSVSQEKKGLRFEVDFQEKGLLSRSEKETGDVLSTLLTKKQGELLKKWERHKTSRSGLLGKRDFPWESEELARLIEEHMGI